MRTLSEKGDEKERRLNGNLTNLEVFYKQSKDANHILDYSLETERRCCSHSNTRQRLHLRDNKDGHLFQCVYEYSRLNDHD